MNNSKLTATINGTTGGAKDVIDIGGAGHGAGILLAGEDSNGRSRALRSLVESLAKGRSAEELEIHAFGRQTILKTLPDIPHVKARLETDKPPMEAMGFFAPEMERRQGLFASARVASLAEYRERTGEAMPTIVLVVEAVCSEDDLPLVEGMRPALVNARAVGIYAVFASADERMAERLADALAPLGVVRFRGGEVAIEQAGAASGLKGDYGYVVCRVMPKGHESARVFALAKGFRRAGFSWVSSLKHCTWFDSRKDAEDAILLSAPSHRFRATLYVSEVCLRT